MRRLCALLLCLILLVAGCTAAPPPSFPAGEEVKTALEPVQRAAPALPIVSTLAVCGDCMSHKPQIADSLNKETGEYSYYHMFAAAAPYVTAADYGLVNLEVPLAGGPDYDGYPTFNAPDGLAYSLKEAGFDLCLTANNHSLDRGWRGLSRTLDVLDEVGLAHVGTSRTQEEYDNNIAVADVNGISIAFLGYSYGTNGIRVPKDHPYAINLFNTDYLTSLSTPDYDKMAADLAQAEALGTDMIAVLMHWGNEYQTKESKYQDTLADFLFDHGADIVLGGHSHVPQPMGFRTITDPDGSTHQGFVSYSLGNFISGQYFELTDTTAVLTLELTKDQKTGVAEVTGYAYAPMLMLNRGAGTSPRFQLLDAHNALAAGGLSATLEKRLQKAIDDCHTIFGPERDTAGQIPFVN